MQFFQNWAWGKIAQNFKDLYLGNGWSYEAETCWFFILQYVFIQQTVHWLVFGCTRGENKKKYILVWLCKSNDHILKAKREYNVETISFLAEQAERCRNIYCLL